MSRELSASLKKQLSDDCKTCAMEKPAGHVPGSANDFAVSRLEDKEQDDKY
jgi:hypothetical protein